jgi:hypothetical protein
MLYDDADGDTTLDHDRVAEVQADVDTAEPTGRAAGPADDLAKGRL